jgi:TonB family protein
MPLRTLARSLLLIAGLAIVLSASSSIAANDVTQYLNDKYKDKTLILRGFYSASTLKYDAGGRLIEPSLPDDWTVAGVVRVENVRLSGGRLNIAARRLHLRWSGGLLQEMHDQASRREKDEKKDRSLRIEIGMAAETADAVDMVLSQVFLTGKDSLAEVVPDYWRPCLVAALTSGSQRYPTCRISGEFLGIPGVRRASDGQQPSESPSSDGTVFNVGKGVTAPRIVHQSDPAFSDAARRARLQGTVTLSLIVDKMGQARDIRIVSPMGMGLDRNAVEAVSKWRFNPGTKDGEPVAVPIAVEVDFHLY